MLVPLISYVAAEEEVPERARQEAGADDIMNIFFPLCCIEVIIIYSHHMVFQNVLAYSVIIIILTGNVHHNLTRTGCYFVQKRFGT